MVSTKSLLLASAAGLATVAAQAADLPVKKAAPVEYVRICSAYGAGFFYIPGTDTCLRVGGRARLEAGYARNYARSAGNGDLSQFRGLGRLNLDARSQTGYGTLRAFVRFEIASRTGAFLRSGTQERIANAFAATGIDTAGRVQQYVNVDKAFVQFAGLTAGRASSFFDFYAHDFEIIGASAGSELGSTNLLAYTGTFGEGFSATISLEDPNFRKTPLFGSTAVAGTNLSPTIAVDAFGRPVGLAFQDVIQRSRLPDFVGVLRYDGSWGSAQLAAAVHEVNGGNISSAAFFDGTTPNAATVNAPRPQTAYGWAVQGGVKVNLPMIAKGDALYLEGSYAEGAQNYTGYSFYTGSYAPSIAAGNIQGAPFSQYFADAVLNPFNGRFELSTAWTVMGSYLHYWTPEWRSALFGSYGEITFPKGARTNLALFNFNGLGNPVTSPAAFAYSGVLRDNSEFIIGTNIIWSPVQDLDIGIEGLYTQVNILDGRVVDLNKSPGQSVARIANGVPVNAAGQPVATTKQADAFQVRMRVQRDF
ncbi:porin [Methylobacterium sp. JK268]